MDVDVAHLSLCGVVACLLPLPGFLPHAQPEAGRCANEHTDDACEQVAADSAKNPFGHRLCEFLLVGLSAVDDVEGLAQLGHAGEAGDGEVDGGGGEDADGEQADERHLEIFA